MLAFPAMMELADCGAAGSGRQRCASALRLAASATPLSRAPRRRLALASFLALALTACGGGSGGGPAIPNACAYLSFDNVTDGYSISSTLPGDASSYSIVSRPSKGSVTLTDPLTGRFTYAPNRNARGTDAFQFQAHTGDGSSNVATYRLVYTPRIMPLGDSITWGGPGAASCPDHVGYREPLHDSLIGGGYVVDFVGTLRSGAGAGLADPDHEGHGAWRADELVAGKANAPVCTGSGRLDEWLDQTRPDVVLLHAGTNDLNSGGDPVLEASDIKDILDVINLWEFDHWPITVVVARIINIGQKESATTRFNDTVLNEIVRPAIDSGDEVLSVDQQGALDASDYLDDLHPNAAGYRKMADVWLAALTGVLPKCP